MKHRIAETQDNLDARQFELAVKILADTLSYGSDSSPFLGSGMEYAQSRIYQPGDPVKLIDWRVTARTGRVHVKEYEAPKRLPIYIIIDTSASMCVGSTRLTKYAWAVHLSTGLALAAQRRMSPIAFIGCGERDIKVDLTLSRNVVLETAHNLRHYQVTEETKLGTSLRKLAPNLRNKSVVLVLSDFHDPDAIPALKLLAHEHDCVALHLLDPTERGKFGGGIFRAREAETGHRFVGHGGSTWFDIQKVRQQIIHGGIDHLMLPIDEPFLPKIKFFLKRRNILARN